MDTRYAPNFTFEETVAQIDILEKYIGVGKTPFLEDETVFDLQVAIERRYAGRRADLMTKWRGQDEEEGVEEIHPHYSRIIGAVALDILYRDYEESGDTVKGRKRALNYLQESKTRMVALDYQYRLEASWLERLKRGLATRDKTRLIVPNVLASAATIATGVATSQIISNNETTFSGVDLSLTQGGMIGAAAAVAGITTTALKRNGPRNVGRILSNQVHTNLRTYMLEHSLMRDKDGRLFTPDELYEKYAERDLAVMLGSMALVMINFEVTSKDDLMPMIQSVLDVSESAMYSHVGISQEESWLDQFTSSYSSTDFHTKQ